MVFTPRRRQRRAGFVPRAFAVDIRRTITGNLKRFVSLFVITALGATMLVGLKAACDDLRVTADAYYDSQRLFDISVRSTLGLTADDIDALAEVQGVSVAEGGYEESAYTEVDGAREQVEVRALSPAGINEPQVVAGRMPRDVGEVAVTEKYLEASGKQLGDTVTFKADASTTAGADGAEGAAAASDGDAAAGTARAEDAASEAAAADAASSGGATASTDDDTAAATAAAADTDPAASSSSAVFEQRAYTITAVVLDPTDVNAGSKTMSFRSSTAAPYAFFLTPAAVVDRSVFTVAYLLVEGADGLASYSDAYERHVDAVKQRVEQIRDEREQARADEVRADAEGQIAEQQQEAAEQLDAASAQLESSQAALDAGRSQLDAAQGKLSGGAARVNQGLQKLAAGLGCSVDGIAQALEAQAGQLESAAQQLTAARAQLTAAGSMLSQLPYVADAWPADAWGRLVSATDVVQAQQAASEVSATLDPFVSSATGALDELIAYVGSDAFRQAMEDAGNAYDRLPSEVKQAIEDALSQAPESLRSFVRELLNQAPDDIIAQLRQVRSLVSQLSDLAPGMVEVVRGEVQLKEGRAKLAQAQAAYAQLTQAREQTEAGSRELTSKRRELEAGQAELDRGNSELAANRADVDARFATAYAGLDGLPHATWYIQGREMLTSYASIDSDASSIESIATVFPLIFFTVAVLMSLTTVTRMIEEDRGLIGLYKALGYSRGQILFKYLAYAGAACLAGGVAGDILGFVVLPKVLFVIFDTMYALPDFNLQVNIALGAAAIALFAVGIMGATALSCRHALREVPASLMRPRSPRAGKRILLERIGPLWRHLGFLNKVSARNLFRYKKRFFMTVFGIAGCTALMVCGLGIRDTVISLKPRQYGDAGIARYDLMTVTTDDGFAAGEDELAATGAVEHLLEARIDTVAVEFGDERESMQVVVVPRGADLSRYMALTGADGAELSLPQDGTGVLITKNAEQVLGFSAGDMLELEDSSMRTASVRVDGVALNYLGNFVFMTEDVFARVFGEACVPNAFLAQLSGSASSQIALADTLAASGTFVSVTSTARIAEDFSSSFQIIDVVVYVVTVMAAALAFAVVFTLSNTNISERERELATIKVLGFRRREVHVYINKETIVLTLIGIVAGCPMGYAITRFLTYVLRMPSLYFDTVVDPLTYVYAGALSLVFTLLICMVTNRSLDRIDMVGALKSAE